MKSRTIHSIAMLLLFFSINAYGNQQDPSKDLLKEASSMNSKHHPSPTTSYRKGHVSIHPTRNYVKVNETGYTINLPGAYPIATPAVHKGKLYVSGGFGSKQFHCFDAKTGKTIWTINLDDDGPSSCVIENDVVVFNTESCTLFACSADTGKMLWSWWLGDPLTSAPAVFNGRVFTTYPANGQSLALGDRKRKHADATHIMGCFDLYSGKILWQKWIDGDAISAPVVVDHEVYITTFSGTIYTFSAADGTIRSAVQTRATSAPTIIADQIYYTKRTDRQMDSVKEAIASGRKHKPHRVAIYHEKNADYLDQKIQKQSEFSKKSKFLDAGNGFSSAPQASGYAKAYSNIGQDGRIFMGTQNGQVICINTQDPNLTGWPMWGRNAAHTGIVQKGHGKRRSKHPGQAEPVLDQN